MEGKQVLHCFVSFVKKNRVFGTLKILRVEKIILRFILLFKLSWIIIFWRWLYRCEFIKLKGCKKIQEHMNNASCTFIVLNAWEWCLLHKNEWTLVKALMWTSCKLKDFKSKLGFSDMEMIDWNKVIFLNLIVLLLCWS